MRSSLALGLIAALACWGGAAAQQVAGPQPAAQQPATVEQQDRQSDNAGEQPGDPAQYRQAVMAAYALDPTDPEVLFRRGEYYRAIGNEALAEQDLRAAVQLPGTPTSLASQIWRELALTLEVRGDLWGALAAWNEAIRQSPGQLSLYVSRGGIKLRLGDQDGAEDDFHLALAATREDAGVLGEIADAHVSAGFLERALQYYQRADSEQHSPELSFDIAHTFWSLGDHVSAQRELDRALAERPGVAEWLNFAGDLARQRNDTAVALELYRQAALGRESPLHQADLARLLTDLADADAEAAWDALVADYANHAAAWLERGSHLCQLGEHSRAIADFQQALKLVPESADAEARWAQCLAGTGDIDGAVMHYRRALGLDFAPSLYLDLIAVLERHGGREAEVAALWDEMLSAFQSHPEAVLANGERLTAAGNYQAALAVFERGAELSPGDARFPRRAGDCQFQLGDYSAAAAFYGDALDLRYDVAVIASLARAYTAMGGPTRNDHLWPAYESLYPADAELVRAHGDVLYSGQDYRGALEQYRAGGRLAPGDATFRHQAALCLLMLDEPADAVEEAKAALELAPAPEYYSTLARAYGMLGEPDLAAAQFQQGLALFPDDAGLNENYALFMQQSGGSGALTQLEHAAELSGGSEMHLTAAEQALTEGDEVRAEENYLRARGANPADIAAATGLALMYAGQDRRAELLQLMVDAAGAMPAEAYSVVADELGAWWIDSRNYQSGSKFFEDLLDAAGPHPTLFTALALLYWLDGGGATALDVLAEALANTAAPPYFMYYLQARITYEEHGAAAARVLAEALLDNAELDEDGFLLVIDIYRDLGEAQLRVDIADLALTWYPDSTALYEQLALAYYFAGQVASAIALLEDTGYQALWFPGRDQLLGICYLDEGNFVKAASFLADAVARDDTDAALWATLGEARYFMGAYPEARQALTSALAIDDGLAAAQLWLGFVLLEQGELSGAKVAFAGVLGSTRADSFALGWATLGLGRVAGQSGERTRAAELLDEAGSYGVGGPLFDAELNKARTEAGLK